MFEHQVQLETSTMDINERRARDNHKILSRELHKAYTRAEIDRMTEAGLRDFAERHNPGRGELAFREAVERFVREHEWVPALG